MMVERLTNPCKVWDNGVVTPFNIERLDLVEFHNKIREETGAKFGIATRWSYQGRFYENTKCPVPIPDMSGLVYTSDKWKRWIVLSPDGGIKLVIDVPQISAKSMPENGELGEPRHMKDDPPHVMYGEGSDGNRDDCRFFFNMHTGLLERVELVGRHW
jgi:hypothetical protein